MAKKPNPPADESKRRQDEQRELAVGEWVACAKCHMSIQTSGSALGQAVERAFREQHKDHEKAST